MLTFSLCPLSRGRGRRNSERGLSLLHKWPMMPLTQMSTIPPNDTRTVTDDRIQDEIPKPQGTRQGHMYVSTADGDVKTLVAETSFDENDKQEEARQSWQGVRATEDGKSAAPERTHPSPGDDRRAASHGRNLSAHFFDAATIRDSISEPAVAGVSFDDQSQRSYPIQHSSQAPIEPPAAHLTGVSPVSPSVGRKHRRGFSEEMSNPAFAHRRINSIGIAAPVERGPGHSYYGNSQQQDHPSYASAPASRHHRQDSAGLDMLSAAIHATDVPREELAGTVGTSNPAEQPAASLTEAPRESQRSPHEQSMMRMSPSAMGAAPYDYAQTNAMGAPAFRPPHGAPQPVYQQGPVPPPSTSPYPPQVYYHSHPYYPPPQGAPLGYHQRQMSQGHPMGYPMQYAPPAPYGKVPPYPSPHQQHMAPPSMSSAEPIAHQCTESNGKIETDEQLFASQDMSYQAAPTPQQWGGPPRPGTSTGVQTFVTTMSVGDGRKTMHAAPTHKVASTNTDPSSNEQQPPVPSHVSHHRKMSSFSSLSTILGSTVFPEDQAAQGGHHRPGSSYFHNPIDQSSRPTGPPPSGAHHRSMSSSMSFLNVLDDKTLGGHHRSTSSSVSFLQGLDDNFDPHEAFSSALDGNGQQNFFGSNTMTSSPYSAAQKGPCTEEQYGGGPPHTGEALSSAQCVPILVPVGSSTPKLARAPETRKEDFDRLAAGGTSKRVRRKCTVEGCPNRVVQGGLCISHGAKRKQCKHPGCTKNVKKAGLCSTHGPARKRCEAEGCSKVAVQGGRCIAHGAKKKMCDVDGCRKQAILSGMCKKHHDQSTGVVSGRHGSDISTASERGPSPTVAATAAKPAGEGKRPSHTRGLSIFQEVSPENIQNILGSQDQGSQENRAQPDAFGYNNRMM